MLVNLKKGRQSPLKKANEKSFATVNKTLGFEMSNALDETMGTFLAGVDSRDGYALVYRINTMVNQCSSERVSALHDRFADPVVHKTAVTRKGDVSRALHE